MTYDNDRTPEGKDRWTEAKYRMKIKNMAAVICDIDRDETGTPPTIIGVCEIENRKVLEDLLNDDSMYKYNYGIIHFESPDRRGIDVGLLYRKGLFTPTNASKAALLLFNKEYPYSRIYTRDQLVVSGMLDGEMIHFIINHWPSRSGGELVSKPKRIKAAQLNRRLVDSIFSIDPYAKIISMGDFNDDPNSESIKTILNPVALRDTTAIKSLYNPMEGIFRKGEGSLAWRDRWNLFDQLIISTEFLKRDFSSYRFFKAGIYKKELLITASGPYKGYPFRSYNKQQYTGGYSDHFPVYLFLIKK